MSIGDYFLIQNLILTTDSMTNVWQTVRRIGSERYDISTQFNPFVPKISVVILLSICHIILMMLVKVLNNENHLADSKENY